MHMPFSFKCPLKPPVSSCALLIRRSVEIKISKGLTLNSCVL